LQPTVSDPAITYTAQEFRQYVRAQLTMASGIGGEQGVLTASNFAVTQRGAGANLSTDVASGFAYIVGDDVTNQGTYDVWNDGTINVTGWTVPGAGTFHHRLELQIQDKLSNGAFSGYVAVLVPKLDTGGGLPAEDNSAITLATIDVPTGSSSITNSMINDYRQRIGPISAVKTADLARTHSTTPLDDPDLQLSGLAVSATYDIEGQLFYKGGQTPGDLAWTWRTSGSSGGFYDALRTGTNGSLSTGNGYVWGDTHSAQNQTPSSTWSSVWFRGEYTTGAAPPQLLVLQWAQNSDSGTATTLSKNSWLRARRLA